MKNKFLLLIPFFTLFLVAGVLGANPVSTIMFPSNNAVYAEGNTSGIIYANGSVVTDTTDFVHNVSLYINGTLNTTITAGDSGYPADLNLTQINFTYTFGSTEKIAVIVRTCLNSSTLNCTNATLLLESDQVAPTISAGTPASGYSGQTVTFTTDDSASVCKFDVDSGRTFNTSRYSTDSGGSSPTITNVERYVSGSGDLFVFCRDDHLNVQNTVFKHSFSFLDGSNVAQSLAEQRTTSSSGNGGVGVLKNLWNIIFGKFWFWG